MIIADTSGLYSIFNRRQPEHQAARDAVVRDGGPLVLSPLVLAELDYFILARLGAEAEQTVLAELKSPAYRLAPFDNDDFKLASEVAVKYGDMQLGLTAVSLDYKHFGAVKPLTSDASFTLLPRDDQP